jgi:two-component system response regulator (stage 0 sporulation protein A)
MNNNAKIYMLNKLGMSSHLKGYEYILYSLDLIGSKHIKDIYYNLSIIYNTTPSAIERDIRTSIEYLYLNGNINYLDTLFNLKYNQTRPTNKQFIMTIYYELCYNLDGDLWKKENTKIY